jgi:hypothetical protein
MFLRCDRQKSVSRKDERLPPTGVQRKILRGLLQSCCASKSSSVSISKCTGTLMHLIWTRLKITKKTDFLHFFQNERFDDWQPTILQLRKLFTGYKSLILVI